MALISFAVTAKLICIFVFAYAKYWFSHDAAQIILLIPPVVGTVKPVLSDHIKIQIFGFSDTHLPGGCLLLQESSAENSCLSFLHYFHSAISNHLSIGMSMSPEWMVI